MSRKLTDEENGILNLIQEQYGPQNSVDRITWMDDAEAILFITDQSGAAVSTANLTNLADWRIDGTIENDDELLRDWLQVKRT